MSWSAKDWTRGQLDELLKKVGGDQVGRKILSGELKFQVIEPERTWHEKDGAIHLSVTSDGTTGEEWVKRLQDKDFRLSGYARQVLLSSDFKPTDGITTEIAVLKGMLFSDNDRVTKKIRKEAKNRGYTTPSAEVACLIREKFSDEDLEEMGLYWVVVMHEPIKDSGGDSSLLGVRRGVDCGWFGAFCGSPDDRWLRGGGFAFVVRK